MIALLESLSASAHFPQMLTTGLGRSNLGLPKNAWHAVTLSFSYDSGKRRDCRH